MFRKFSSTGIIALAALATACGQGGSEPEAEVTPSAPPVAEEITPAEPVRPAEADPAAIPISWTGSELSSSANITAEAVEGSAVLVRSSDGDDSSGGPTTGANVEYLLPATADISRMTLTISVVAQSVSGLPTPFSVAYSTNYKGNSGWIAFEAEPEASVYTFDYTIPPRIDLNSDFIGISVAQGDSVLIDSISVALAEPEVTEE